MGFFPDNTLISVPEEGIRWHRGVAMETRDGTTLVADIFEPPGDHPVPVLLMRQPYGRDIASTVVYAQPAWFCRKGFLVVVQDVRGRGDSSGKFHAFHHEGEDGYDTVQWAASLPRSNGKVGMYGFSYQGSTQILAAAERPPALAAIAPHMTAFDLYSGWFYRSGILQLNTTLGWGAQMLREDVRRLGDWELAAKLETAYLNPGALAHSFPINKIPALTNRLGPSYVKEWLEEDEPSPYWSAFDFLQRAAEIADVPCFHLAGWYDFYARGSMDGYRALQAIAPDKQRLVIGPWIHIPWGDKLAGVNLGPEARYPVDEALVQWMHFWCGDKSSRPDWPTVTYFVMGSNQWEQASTWPPESTAETRFFLSSTGAANSRFGDGQLLADALAVRGVADRYVYDPEVPVTAPGAVPAGYQWGPVDLSVSQMGNNLLVYKLPCTGKIKITGQPTLKLFVRSTAEDTAFVARLSHGRDGVNRFLTLGACRLRDGVRHEDGCTELTLTLDDIACEVANGDELLLDIASSAFPLLARHPNTLTPPQRINGAWEFKRATQTVLHDRLHPSSLTLPTNTHA